MLRAIGLAPLARSVLWHRYDRPIVDPDLTIIRA
jgi:hypothetical protein